MKKRNPSKIALAIAMALAFAAAVIILYMFFWYLLMGLAFALFVTGIKEKQIGRQIEGAVGIIICLAIILFA